MGAPEWSIEPLEAFDWAISKTAFPYSREALRPGLGDIYEPSTLEHDAHTVLNVAKGVLTVLEIVEIFLEGLGIHIHPAAAWTLAAAEPAACVLGVVVTGMELYRVFDIPLRIQNQKGIVSGLMWEVMGLPDVERTTRPAPTEDVEIPLSPGERAAWADGVRYGREMARDPEVQVEIKKALAIEMFLQQREADTDPHERAWQTAVDRTMNRIWSHAHEDLPPLKDSRLSWPGADYGDPVRILSDAKGEVR